MPQVNIVVSHQQERTVVIEKLKSYSSQAREQFAQQVTHIEEVWTDDGQASFAFRLMGFQVTGTTTTSDESVEVAVQLPFAAIPIRGMIEKELESRIRTALS